MSYFVHLPESSKSAVETVGWMGDSLPRVREREGKEEDREKRVTTSDRLHTAARVPGGVHRPRTGMHSGS